jgi:hypothetical protein
MRGEEAAGNGRGRSAQFSEGLAEEPAEACEGALGPSKLGSEDR